MLQVRCHRHISVLGIYTGGALQICTLIMAFPGHFSNTQTCRVLQLPAPNHHTGEGDPGKDHSNTSGRRTSLKTPLEALKPQTWDTGSAKVLLHRAEVSSCFLATAMNAVPSFCHLKTGNCLRYARALLQGPQLPDSHPGLAHRIGYLVFAQAAPHLHKL